MSKFHVNSKGEPGPCSAKEGSCPFGSDAPHFETKELAREHYEKENSQNTMPVKMSGKEYSALAKASKNEEELMKVALKAPEGSTRILAKNDSASEEVLLTAYSRAKKDETKVLLETSKNFPVRLLSAKGIEAIYKDSPSKVSKILQSNEITYETAKDLKGTRVERHLNLVVSNPNNKLSPEELFKLTEGDRNLTHNAIRSNEKYPTFANIENFDKETLEFVAASKNDVRASNAAFNKILDMPDKNMQAISRAAANPWVSPTTLAKAVDQINDHHVDVAVFRNPSADKETKDMIAERNTTAASLKKIDDFKEKDFKTFYNIQQAPVSYSGTKSIYKLDANEIKKAGLNSEDVDSLIRYHKGDYLFSTEYNESTGEYSGYND